MKNKLLIFCVLQVVFLRADTIDDSVKNIGAERIDKKTGPMTVDELVGYGLSEEQAQKHVKTVQDLDKFKVALQKVFGPKDSDEIRDETFLKIIDTIRKHKQLSDDVKIYQDHDNVYLGNAGTAKTLDMLVPLAPIILSKRFFNYPKSTQVWILYHEMQHVKQARGEATTCLSDTSVDHERDADLSASRDIDCCHCLNEVLASNYNVDISDLGDKFAHLTVEQKQQIREKIQKMIEDMNKQGYLTIEELQNIIQEKIDSGKHDMCKGHKKLLFSDWYYANNEVEKLQDFLPNKA